MVDDLRLTALQWLRTRLHLFVSGVRKRLTVGVRAVLVDGRQVLLIRHTYVPGWHFPGGGVEPFETAELAAARETMEETGYAVVGRPELFGFYLNRLAGGARDHVAVYVWREFRVERKFSPSMEIAELRWFDLNALPEDVDAGTARRIVEMSGKVRPAPEW